MIKLLIIVIVVLAGGFFLLRWLLPAISPRPDGLGVINGRLSPCPDSPNCVSTFSNGEEHGMDSLAYDGETSNAHHQIINIINQMPNTTIINTDSDYIYAEFRTPLLNLIDDVEFYFDSENGLIHFRSASRLGYSDLGVNRERMNVIIEAFNR